MSFALQAMEAIGLDKVVFIPEEQPRGKQDVTGLEHRVALLDRAVKPHGGLLVRTLNTQRFCVRQTLPELRAAFDGELWLLLGSDVAGGLGRWPDLDELLDGMSLVIGMRGVDSRVDLEQVLGALDVRTRPNYVLLDSLLPMESSTRIRRGEAARDAVPAVAEYIQRHGLYGSER